MMSGREKMEFGNCKDLPVWAQILLHRETPAEGDVRRDGNEDAAAERDAAAA